MFSVIIYGATQPRLQPAQARRDQLQRAGRSDVRSRRRDPVYRLQHAGRPSDLSRGDPRHAHRQGQETRAMLRVRPEQHVHLKSKRTWSRSNRSRATWRCGGPTRRTAGSSTPTPTCCWCAQEGKSLSNMLAALPDGFYQVPRFEIPRDAVGGGLRPQGSRRQPRQAARSWSMSFHLNQVVHNFMPMKYDALGGDLQGGAARRHSVRDPRLRQNR